MTVGTPSYGEVFGELRQALAATLEVDPDVITEDSLLVDDLDADSLDLLELILTLRDRFSISVMDGEVKALLAELARFLPDAWAENAEWSDDDYAEVTRQLRTRTIVEFVVDRAQGRPR